MKTVQQTRCRGSPDRRSLDRGGPFLPYVISQARTASWSRNPICATPTRFREVTQVIPNYPQIYTYESHGSRAPARIPIIGRYLRGILNASGPPGKNPSIGLCWSSAIPSPCWPFLLSSSAFLLAARFLFGWYCSHRLGIPRVRLARPHRAGEPGPGRKSSKTRSHDKFSESCGRELDIACPAAGDGPGLRSCAGRAALAER